MKSHLVDDDAGLARILREARTVAVLGCKAGAGQPAFYVPAYLQTRGYRILPVNPTLVGQTVFGETVVGTLADLREPADVIDVFRRPEYLPGHAREILAHAVDLEPDVALVLLGSWIRRHRSGRRRRLRLRIGPAKAGCHSF